MNKKLQSLIGTVNKTTIKTSKGAWSLVKLGYKTFGILTLFGLTVLCPPIGIFFILVVGLWIFRCVKK